MRKVLNALYDGAAAVAALFMVGLLVMVLLSVCGRQFNFYVPGTDAYAGYLMAASGFLALAHTLKRGEHIRVTLILSALSGRWKKGMEVWALVFARHCPACLLLQLPPGLAVAHVQRHFHRQRRHPAVDSADRHGGGHCHPGDRLSRRTGGWNCAASARSASSDEPLRNE
jgi:hypothetical protein